VSRTRTYRCLNCLDEVVTRSFDTSHLSMTCPNCESFERFANEAVIERFESLEASPPTELDWERLERREKLLVAERLARTDKEIGDFDVVGDGSDETNSSAEA
jgi:DNA-directed RNA polymerase subunit RPC12/RpoP